MKKLIPIFYSEYGRYINKFRAIPSFIDGLRPVERRILLSLYKEGRKKAVKSATIIGYSIGHLHPHGDACLDYNTEIYSLDGNIYKIGDLCKNKIEQLEVLSLDPITNKLVPSVAKHFRVGKMVDEIYQIKLSNGNYIKCSDNHPIKLKNGDYVQAKDLKLFDFIESGIILDETRPRIRTDSSPGLEFIQNIIKTNKASNNNIIHHKDKNPKNNSISNLTFLTREQHAKLHGDYKLGLQNGRLSMFSIDGKYRQAIKQKNSLLMKEYNKHQTILKAIAIIKHIKEQGLKPTQQLYNQYRHIRYNAPFIETLIRKGIIKNFEELLSLEQTFKLNTDHAKNLTNKYTKSPRKTYNSSENAVTLSIIKSISEIIEYIIECKLLRNENITYVEAKEKLIQKYGTGLHNISGRSYPTIDTIKQYFGTTNLNSLITIISETGFLTYVEEINIIKLEQPIEVFDFTVDKFENMFVVTGKKNDIIYISNVHNSCYGTLINMVDQGYAKGEGNWGSPGLEDAEAAQYRYTEVCLKKWVDDLAFTYLDEKYVPYEEFELEPEPIYLPSPIPIGLIGHGVITGISFYRTLIPKYKLSDLAKRLVWILNGKKIKEEVVIQPYCKDCSIQEIEPGEFRKILITGVGSLNYIPHGKLETNRIRIQGRAPLTSFVKKKETDNTKKKKRKFLSDIVDEFEVHLLDNSGEILDIVIEPKRKNINLLDLGTKIWQTYLIKRLNFNCIFCNDEGTVETLGIDSILENNYNLWKYSVQLKNIDDFNKLSNRKVELIIVQIIRYIFEQYKSNTVDEIVEKFRELKKNSNISIEIDIFDIDTDNWKKETKDISEQDIIDVCNKRTIKNLVETIIDIQKIDKELLSAKSLIDNCDKNCLEYIKELSKD